MNRILETNQKGMAVTARHEKPRNPRTPTRPDDDLDGCELDMTDDPTPNERIRELVVPEKEDKDAV